MPVNIPHGYTKRSMVIVYTICDRVHTELEGGYIRNIIDVKMKEEVEKGGGED